MSIQRLVRAAQALLDEAQLRTTVWRCDPVMSDLRAAVDDVRWEMCSACLDYAGHAGVRLSCDHVLCQACQGPRCPACERTQPDGL
jgi:hypothetical protein